MNNKMFGILLFLLYFSWNLRNSSANLYDGSTIPTVTAVIGGTNHLKEMMQRIQNIDILKSKKLDVAIEKFEVQADKLPYEIKEFNWRVLEKLYGSQNKIVRIRVLLEGAAAQVKSHSENLINIYDQNDASVDLLNYSVTKMLKLEKHVKEILEDADIKLTETQSELSYTQSMSNTYKYILEINTNLLNETLNVFRTVQIIAFLVGLIFATRRILYVIIIGGIIIGGDLKINGIIQPNMDNLFCVYNVIDTVSGLINHNSQLSSYVKEDNNMIDVWKIKLQASFCDHEDGITPMDMTFGIALMKDNLRVLIKACDGYLEHELHEDFNPIKSNMLPFPWFASCFETFGTFGDISEYLGTFGIFGKNGELWEMLENVAERLWEQVGKLGGIL